MPRTYFTPEKFWARVAKTETCWLWTGRKCADGYGILSIGGKVNVAHRKAWELVNGEAISPDLIAMHKCDNPPCVNPAHLFLGTRLDNNRDSMAKGRRRTAPPRGENNSSHKLTWEEVCEIRQRHPHPLPRQGQKFGKHSMRETAATFGIGKSTVRMIILRKKWKYPPEEWQHPDIPRKGPNPAYLPSIAARLE